MSVPAPSPSNSKSNPNPTSIAKVLVVGNVCTGKTSVINRFARNKFSQDYQTTIGVDFALKRVKVGAGELNIQMWDIAGQERFSGLSRIFYAHSTAAIIVYDVTQRDTFDAVIRWKSDIDSKVFLPSGAAIPVLLLGNKADLLDENVKPCVPTEDLDHFLEANSFFAHALCSAKTGLNLKEAIVHLITKIHANNQSEALLEQQRHQPSSSTSASNSSSASPTNASNTPVTLQSSVPDASKASACC